MKASKYKILFDFNLGLKYYVLIVKQSADWLLLSCYWKVEELRQDVFAIFADVISGF